MNICHETQEKLDMPLDDVITILRHYNWSTFKMEEKWFDDMYKLSTEIGLQFDQALICDHPSISNSLEMYNNNTCSICLCEWDKDEQPE